MLYVYPYYYYVALMNNQALWDLIVSTYISMWDVLFIFWSFPLPLSRGFSVPVILAYVMLSSVKCKVTMDTQIADNQNFDFGKRWCLVLALSRIRFFLGFFLQVFLCSAHLSTFVFPQMFVANTWLGSIVFTLSLEQQAERISPPPCVP